MVEVYKNIVPSSTISKLLEYFQVDDDRTDRRPDVHSKHPRWGVDAWPEEEVKHILDHVLDLSWEVEEIVLHYSKIHYPLHVDSGLGVDKQPIYKSVLIPLHVEGPCGTLFFDNHWTGHMSKFSRNHQYEYGYQLDNNRGSKTFVRDIRELKTTAIRNPESIEDFDITSKFISTLDYLIDARAGKKMNQQNTPIGDYQDIIGITDQPFPEDARLQYCKHIDANDLLGLKMDCYVEWNIGNAIIFDRTQIHSAATGEIGKIGLTVFTNRRAN